MIIYLVIITEMIKSDIIYKINKKCHMNNKGFIYWLSCGLFGIIFSAIFSDFDQNHIITDKTGIKKEENFI